LFLSGCFSACLYCSLPWDDFTTDHLCRLLELIVSKTSSLVVCLWLFFLGSLSKNLLLRQFVCRNSSQAIHPQLFFSGCTFVAVLLGLYICGCSSQTLRLCTSAAVLLKLSGCMSATVLVRLLGCMCANVLLRLFACSCLSEAIPLSKQFLLLDSSPHWTESSSHCNDTCSHWDICLQMAVHHMQMTVQLLLMTV